MSGHKKNIFSVMKDLLGGKTITGSAESDERKKKIIQEVMKETASSKIEDEIEKAALLKLLGMLESQLNEKNSALEEAVSKQKQSELEASDKAALMKTLSMLETQLNEKNSALEEAVSRQRNAELEVQKLRQASQQKKNESEKKINLIKQLISIEDDSSDTKAQLKQKNGNENNKNGGQGNGEGGGQRRRQKSKQRNKNENKTKLSVNQNVLEQNKTKEFENKNLDEHNLLKFNNVKIFNPKKDNRLPPNSEQLQQSNHPNNFVQGPPMNNFSAMGNNSFPNHQYPMQPNQNIFPQQHNHNMFGQQPNQNMFPQPQNFGPYNNFSQHPPPLMNTGSPQPFNSNQFPTGPSQYPTGPNQYPTGPNQYPTGPNQYRNNQQFGNGRGRGGFNRGRGNFRGNTRGGFNPRNQSGGNNSSLNVKNKEEEEFVFVSKKDITRNSSNKNHVNDGHFQNTQKTNFKKKKNRPVREQQNDEKEKDDDSESVLNGMIDVFSKMFGNISSQLANPKTEEASSPKPAFSNTTRPNHQTGAIKKNPPEKKHHKQNNKMEGNEQMKDNKKKNNPLKLFVGSGFPSEEEASSRNINLQTSTNNKHGMHYENDFCVRITNLSQHTTPNDLEQLIKPFGRYSRRFLGLDKESGVCKGFAYAYFIERESAENAIRGLNGYVYADLTLNANWAKPGTRF